VPETGVHLEVRTALYLVLRREIGGRAVVGSDQFVYWDPTDPTKCVAPDVMVRLGEPNAPFPSWKTWERGAPHLAVEIMSSSDARDRNWEQKLERYRQAGVAEVVRFDPEDDDLPLRLWDLVDGDLVERELSGPQALLCDAVGFYWYIQHSPQLGHLLRLARDAEGVDVLPTPDEAVEQERAAKEAALARVAELEAELRGRT
jgi:Putative restriction endonuclease